MVLGLVDPCATVYDDAEMVTPPPAAGVVVAVAPAGVVRPRESFCVRLLLRVTCCRLLLCFLTSLMLVLLILGITGSLFEKW